MSGAADYSAVEHLRDGRPIEIRALRPDDRAEMLAAVGRTSSQSLQRRFFAPKKGFSEQELAFFLNVDFENHVALVAQIDEDESPTIVGGGRYIVVRPGQAEIAFRRGRYLSRSRYRHDPHAASGCFGARRGPQGADCGGVTREHRDVESVQEVRLPARFQTGASGHTSDPTACLTPSISANAASKNSSIF